MRTSLQGIARKAKENKRHRFRDLYRLLNEEGLLESWRRLNKAAAAGADRVTAREYERRLLSNIRELVKRLKEKRYKAKLVRRVYIPKGGGKLRPLGIPALEDRLVQGEAAQILNAIYEQDFLSNSCGFR
jgi:RNA-directed DNA polymerase